MDHTSFGPTKSLSASETKKKRAAIESIDAQKVNEADARHGMAGAEAMPFAGSGRGHDVPHRPGDSEMPPDEPNDMISGRRNTRRDDASDAPDPLDEAEG